jgi:hypothetical protein
MTPFEVVRLINQRKDLDWLEVAADYLPYIINLSYSFNPQTILISNELNKNHSIPLEWQFQFYKNAVAKGTKNTWIKGSKEIQNDLSYIMLYYNVSQIKAEEIAKILSQEQIKEIELKYNKNKGKQNE